MGGIKTLSRAGLFCALLLPVLGSISTASEPPPSTPAEKYAALVKKHQQAERIFSDAYTAAKTDEDRKKVSTDLGKTATADHYAEDFLKLIQENPKDPVTLKAFSWLVAHLRSSPQTERAIEILERDWITDERFESVCGTLYYYHFPRATELLRNAIAKSPHRAVQGRAKFSLAISLKEEVDARSEGYSSSDREPYEREAEKLLQEVIENYADIKHHTTLGEEAKSTLFELQYLGIGKTPPEIEGEDLDGKKMKLTDFRGKVVLIAFWATWCGPCMADIPHEQESFDRYKDQPFAIVGVNADKKRKTAQRAIAKHGVTWPSFWDGDDKTGPIVRQWNVNSWPTLYLLDGGGVIRYKGERLRMTTMKKGKDGKWEQVNSLDEAVENLMKTTAAKK